MAKVALANSVERRLYHLQQIALAAALVVFVGSLDVSFLKLHSPVTRLKSTGPDWTQSKLRLKMEFMTHWGDKPSLRTSNVSRVGHLCSLRLRLVDGRRLKLEEGVDGFCQMGKFDR